MKLFIRISLSLLIGFFVFQTAYAQTETESRKVGPFSAIEVSGPFEIELTESDRLSVVVEASSRILEDIETHIDDHTLHIQLRKNHSKNIDGPIKVYINAPRLESICGSGAVNIHATNTLRMRDLDLTLSGASNFTADLRVESLEAELSGASNLTLSGNAEEFEIEMSGASNIKAFDLPVREGELSMSGASNAEVHVHGDLNVDASGVSNVVYDGNPEIERSISGMAKISRR